jgi:hypothetical protein
LKETLQAKIEFKTIAERSGLKIRNDHADNGRFADNTFVQHAKTKDKELPTAVSTHIFIMV